MHTKVSCIIPSRNEPYLNKTIQSLLDNSFLNIEVIVVLDGYWPEEVIEDKRVVYIHSSTPKGMRQSINLGVSIAKSGFILKTDAHCMFSKGFDKALVDGNRDKSVSVLRRYPLDVLKWEIEKRTDNKYPIDYMYLDKELHGQPWFEKNNDKELKTVMIDELMSSQGSMWFMEKKYYEYLDLMDEANYGQFSNEFQEIGLKAWLSGGSVLINKNAWYAHWHKTKGRGYSLSQLQAEKGAEYTKKWLNGKVWHKQIYDLEYLINKFKTVPTWR